MSPLRILGWVALASALAIVGVGLLMRQPTPMHIPELIADAPWLIGPHPDAFSYDGSAAQRISGEGLLQLDPETGNGALVVSLRPDASWTVPEEFPLSLETAIAFSLPLETTPNLWMDQLIHGDTAIGDARLPATFALFAGDGRLRLQAASETIEVDVFWSLAHALRQADGAIRNQGLVFSPLLRDRNGFSNPDQLELALLVYPEGNRDEILLHLVFSSVEPPSAWTSLTVD